MEKTSSNKTNGRPVGYRKPGAMRTTFKIRLTEEELQLIKDAAICLGMTLSDFVREAAMEKIEEAKSAGLLQ